MNGRFKTFSVAIFAATISLSAPLFVQPASACSFHTYLPERTMVDYLTQSADVLLARPHPTDPFYYAPIEILKGNASGAPINLLVNSQMRVKLAANADDTVLFARDEGGTWVTVAYVTPSYRKLIDRVLASAPGWAQGYGSERFEIMSGLLNHPNPTFQRLALQEMDQAPYDMLVGLEGPINTDALLKDLWKPQTYMFQPISVLLLGLSDTEEAREEVYEFVERTTKWPWATNLGPYATALIELDGVAGVERLEKLFLAKSRQPLDNLEQVIEALAIQNGVADSDVRTAITEALSRFIAVRPQGGGAVARQFSIRSDWSQGEVLEELLRNHRADLSSDVLPIAVYVAQARGAKGNGQQSKNEG